MMFVIKNDVLNKKRNKNITNKEKIWVKIFTRWKTILMIKYKQLTIFLEDAAKT